MRSLGGRWICQRCSQGRFEIGGYSEIFGYFARGSCVKRASMSELFSIRRRDLVPVAMMVGLLLRGR